MPRLKRERGCGFGLREGGRMQNGPFLIEKKGSRQAPSWREEGKGRKRFLSLTKVCHLDRLLEKAREC